jgi:hypothetical protein
LEHSRSDHLCDIQGNQSKKDPISEFTLRLASPDFSPEIKEIIPKSEHPGSILARQHNIGLA